MEKEEKEQSGQGIKRHLTEAEKKAKYREKERLVKEGKYVKPLIDQAKEILLNEYQMNLAAFFEDKRFKGNKDDQFNKQLAIFVKNQKAKLRKESCEVSGKEKQKEQLNIEDMALRLGNQQIPLLHQSLLNPLSKEDRMSHISKLIKDNLFLFLNYMEGYMPPTEDFLSIILELYYEFDQETATKLFVRVCSMHRGEVLHIDEHMVQFAMTFLLQSKVDNIAAFGLLRLVFQNDISFVDIPVKLLQDFQSSYEQTIQNFYKSIPKLGFQLNEQLPPTCFCFTSPLIKALKEEGNILHLQVPYQFMPYLVQIICYSFTNDEAAFLNFLDAFKLGCLNLYENLLASGFQNLLRDIADRTKAMEPQYFQSLEHATDILKRAFELLQEKKIDKFDQVTVKSLVDSSPETYQIMKQRPKIIKEGSKRQVEQTLDHLTKNNQHVDLSFLKEDFILDPKDKELFLAMGITNLLPIQEICFRFCIQEDLKRPVFIQYDTGQGKTSLCLAIALKNALTKQKVYILNSSKNLLFRDFKKASSLSDKLPIKTRYCNLEEINRNEDVDISYIELATFIECFNQGVGAIQEESFIIIDEYDSILFSGSDYVVPFIKAISKFKKVVALSGTKLEQYHRTFVRENIDSDIIDFSLNQSIKVNQVCHEQQVYPLVGDHRGKIVQLCQAQVQKTPVILILNDSQSKISELLTKVKIPVERLDNKNSQEIDGPMQLFNEKQGPFYGVFIINQEQGRGLDFISNAEIESNCGVYLIIGSMPNQYLQYQQFIGRTGRIGNKGQYSVILYDKEAKNRDGQVYLKQTLLKLQDKEMFSLSQIKGLSQNKQNNLDIKLDDVEEEKKGNDSQIKSMEIDDKKTPGLFSTDKDNNNDVLQMLGNQQDIVVDSEMSESYNSVRSSDESFNCNELNKKQKEKEKQSRAEKKRVQKENDKDDKQLKKQQQKNIAQSEIPVQNKTQQIQREEQSVSTKVDQKRVHTKKQDQEECKTCKTECTCEWKKKQSNEVEDSEMAVVEQISADAHNHHSPDKVEATQQKERADEQMQSPEIDQKEAEEVKMINPAEVTSDIKQKQEMAVVLPQSQADISKKRSSINKTHNLEQEIKGKEVVSQQTKRQEDMAKAKTGIQKTQKELINECYFRNYSNPSIHKEMLNDKVRVEMYQKAIKLACKGKSVLDLGCGSGVLSAFAVQNGAEQVFAVDNADVKDIMTKQLKRMGVDFTRIRYIQGSIESLTAEEIPQVDVIVSEWMGYFLLFENMIGSYIYAKKYLKADGIMIPQQASLHLNPATYDTKTHKIAKKYRKGEVKVVMIAQCNCENLIQEEAANIHTLNFSADLQNPLDHGFSSEFGIIVGKKGLFNAFVGSFDVNLYKDISLSTMPTCEQTHWKQSLFFIDNPIEVSEEDLIEGTIKINADEENHRNLIVKFSYNVKGKGGSQAEECFTFE